jgi:hypothetical protein
MIINLPTLVKGVGKPIQTNMNNFLTKKVEKTAEKYEKTGKKVLKRLKVYAIALGVGLFIIGTFLAFMNVSKWYDENKVSFVSPITIKLQSPVRIEKRVQPIKKASLMPVEAKIIAKTPRTEFEIVNAQKHGQILWRIYQLETQRGLTDHCRLSGAGYGGFGVMNEGEVICYESFEKAVERAEFWFAKLEPEKSLVDALCTWNLGTKGLMNCNYYQDYISL